MDKEWEEVRLFHLKFNHPIAESPRGMDLDRAIARYNWMKEEIEEFLEAVRKDDLVEQADAMIDEIYFALGTLVEMGIKPDKLFEIVQKANMSKLWEDGKPHYNCEGKAIKPSTWKDPHEDLEKVINDMRPVSEKKDGDYND